MILKLFLKHIIFKIICFYFEQNVERKCRIIKLMVIYLEFIAQVLSRSHKVITPVNTF